MPLKTGKSKATQKSNIKELMGAYKSKGKIGSSTPKNKKAAIKQAVAISFSEKRKK